MAQIAPAESPAAAPARSELLHRLGRVVGGRGLAGLAERLVDLHRWVEAEMRDFETQLSSLPSGDAVVLASAHHLLDLDGKHLRPMCVVLASKLGDGFSPAARELAMAVELVHTATLLHDDVIDQGDVRRGQPSARMLYGNAASIYAGDWLLVQALQRIRRAGLAGLLDRMLAIIDEMILAESVQLENRGRLNADRDDYLRVAEGKTAALFRWAMFAGAIAGGLGCDAAESLERYGLHLGVAFQAIDDLLDLDGDARRTGKALFTDLREGKMTYPLILALQRQPGLETVIERCVEAGASELDDGDIDRVLGGLDSTGALRDCRAMARERAQRAIQCLESFPDGPGKTALVTVARATALRES